MVKRVLIGSAVLALGIAAYFVVRIGPKNIIGMLRYDQREEGALKVGDPAPDVDLLATDGTTVVHLAERMRGRPHVLLFGSFT